MCDTPSLNQGQKGCILPCRSRTWVDTV